MRFLCLSRSGQLFRVFRPFLEKNFWALEKTKMACYIFNNMGDAMEKAELIFKNVCMIFGAFGLMLLGFKFDIPELGFISLFFFLLLSLNLFAAIGKDHEEKK